MESPFRHDRWAEYLASDTDLPYSTWIVEQRNLARARVTIPPRQPATRGAAMAILVVIVLACVAATGIAIGIGLLRGGPQ